MKKKLNLLWNLKFNFFSVAERPLTFFAYFLNAKKVGRRRLVIVPATAGGLPLFSHAASCSRPGGGNDRPSGFAQRNGAERRQAPDIPKEVSMKDLFEGVYLKHQKNGESICFIAGRAGETRFVQVLSLIHI